MKHDKNLQKAWCEFQDLYDRYMRLLCLVGENDNIEMIRDEFSSAIDYAMNEWSTPQTRFEMGGYSDFDLGMEDEDED